MKHTHGRGSTEGRGSAAVQSVTSAPPSAADDQGVRIRRYLIAMGLRAACFLLAIVTSGWLRWTFVLGAVVLPYIAVVLANAVGPRYGQVVAPVVPRPGERPALTTETAEPRVTGDRRTESTTHDT